MKNLNLIGVTVPDLKGNEIIEAICDEFEGIVFDFYTMNMVNLEIIAKHRVLPVPTLLIFDGVKVIGRIVKEIPTVDEIRQLISKL